MGINNMNYHYEYKCIPIIIVHSVNTHDSITMHYQYECKHYAVAVVVAAALAVVQIKYDKSIYEVSIHEVSKTELTVDGVMRAT